MKKYLFYLFTLISTAVQANEAGGNISGYVTTSDGQPAVSVTVEVEGRRQNAITNSKGYFLIKNLPEGTQRIRISMLGYETVIEEVNVENGATATVTIELKISSTQLKEFIVSDSRHKISDKRSAYVSRLDIGNLENPQSYTVASKELFLEKNVLDFQHAVQSIPGIALSTTDYQGSSTTFMRGFASNPYIRNGIYFMNLMSGDIQNTERLEAIKGPSGTLYGSQGISYGGLINRVTKKPFSHRAGEVGLSLGSYGYSRLTADLNTPLNEDKTALLRLNAAATWDAGFQDNGYQKTFLFAPTFSYQINDKLDILVDAELNSNKRTAFVSYPTYSYTGRYDELPLDYYKTYGTNKADYPPSTINNFYTQVNYKLNNNWKLSANIAYSNFNFNSGTIGLSMKGTDSLYRDIYDFYWTYNSIDIQPNLTGEFRIGPLKNKLLVGLDYQDIKTLATGYFTGAQDSISLNGPRPAFPIKRIRASQEYSDAYWEADFRQKTYAAYVTDVIGIGERLNVLLSLRYDHYKDGGYNYNDGNPSTGPDGGAWAPKLGVTYQVLKNKIALFANYMQGINYVSPDMEGNTFKPERAKQTEGGVKIDLVDGKLSSTISYYDIQVADKVRPSPNNPNVSIQDGTQESKGVDIDIIASPVKGLNIVAGYAYNASKFSKDDEGKIGKRPYGTPVNSGNVWISYTLKKIGIGAGAVYTDDYFANDDNTLTIPGYTVFNANIFYNTPKFRASISLDNIGNKKYWDLYGTPQMPRRLMGSLLFRF